MAAQQQHRPITNVVVLGATGRVGVPVVEALSKVTRSSSSSSPSTTQFNVTAVTRSVSENKEKFPPHVTAVESDYSLASLAEIFQNQDAVVSCITTFFVAQQRDIIDLAVQCGIVRFIPSEYGLDSTHPDASAYLFVTKMKIEVVEYLRTLEHQMSWTTLVVGAFFDWALYEGHFGWNIARESKVTIYDGGDVEFETTNLDQIGAAVSAILSPACVGETANRHVFVSSFTTTQNKVLAVVEKVLGRKLTVEKDASAALRERSLKALEEDAKDSKAIADLITSCVYGQGGFNLYSRNAEGLWNDRLGLVKEDMEDTVKKALAMAKQSPR